MQSKLHACMHYIHVQHASAQNSGGSWSDITDCFLHWKCTVKLCPTKLELVDHISENDRPLF